MKALPVVKIFVVIAIAFFAIVFLSQQIFAASPDEVRTGEIIDVVSNATGNYVSPVFNTDFKFNLVGFGWRGNDAIAVQIRVYRGGSWSSWYEPESGDYVERDGWRYSTEPVVADQAYKLQYRLVEPSDVQRVKLTYIGEQARHTFVLGAVVEHLFNKASAASSLAVNSRAGWRANEDWRYDVLGKEVWPAEYQWPEKIVIHHTAGDDGGTNPAAVIRGIYYWHAVALGWGDIGYNYLVDQQGNVYEGRYGGDGVIGAHTYRNSACANSRFGGSQHAYNFNKGTVGIAVLGNYDNKTLNNQVRDALTTLIAAKAKDFDIQPNGNSYLFDAAYPNIVGHKDLDCSNCPGRNLYSALSAIRIQAAEKFVSLGGISNPVIKATYVGQSQQSVVVPTGGTKEVWVDFRNDGNVTWRNYKATTLAVVPRNLPSDFYIAAWDSAMEVTKLTTPNVAPGETGRFVFSIKGPSNSLRVREQFALKYDNQIIKDSIFSVTARITGLAYAGSMASSSLRPALFTGGSQIVTVRFTNQGTQSWKRGSLKLAVYDLGDQISRFRSSSWPDQYGQFDFLESEVDSGATATFSFTMTAPREQGLYLNVYRLIGLPDMVQEYNYTITRVDSTAQALLVSQTITPALQRGWRPYITIQYKNTGLTTWNRGTALRIYDLGDQVSRFYDSRWINQYTAARLVESSVKPGQVGTFRFYFKAPTSTGLYFNRFEMVQDNIVIQGSGFSRLTRVD